MNTQKFFLYARKSTDVEDKQVLSIEAQLTELRAYAKAEGLCVIEELVEKRSAKTPGRPVFNQMVSRLEVGEAEGIVCWHPDRLARNSVDGGRIIYLLDCGRLLTLKFPQFWCDNTSQGKFMLNLAFGQSKYYVDALAENTKRGLRQKVRRGEFPSLAPMGYQNDVRNKTIVIDRKRSVLIRKAFELYAANESRLEDVATFLAQEGLVSRGGKPLHRNRITYILTNPFYYGHFRYAGEQHEGKHPPLITKKLFDEVQAVLLDRGRPQYKAKNVPEAFCGLLACASCGMMITAERKVKRQKNGNVHQYIYYRCTKKSKVSKCAEPFVREEALHRQLSSLIETASLPAVWAEAMQEMVERDERDSAQTAAVLIGEAREKVATLSRKLERLLDSYLEQDIEREVYRERKADLMSQKKSLEEHLASSDRARNHWLGPLRAWLSEAADMEKIARDGSLLAKKAACRKIFGSHLLLSARTVRIQNAHEPDQSSPNPYAALRVARVEHALNPKSFNPVRDGRIELPPTDWKSVVLPLN